MARKKNMEKRSEILQIAFQMFGDKGYDQVFIKDIAAEAKISKALFQHYFTKKSEILEIMLQEILEASFHYVERIIPGDQSLYLRLSVYTRLFFTVSSEQPVLHKFIADVISDKTLLRLWINIISQWLGTIRNEEMHDTGERELQIALSFAVAGGTELLLLREEWDVPVSLICGQMVSSFMSILNNSPEDIYKVLKTTDNSLTGTDFNAFNEYCRTQISWYN